MGDSENDRKAGVCSSLLTGKKGKFDKAQGTDFSPPIKPFSHLEHVVRYQIFFGWYQKPSK